MIEKWSQLMGKISEDAEKNNVPVSGQFELTARCNLNCKMCYVCRPSNDKQTISRELPAETWIHVAEEAKKVGMLYLLLTGGEVFIRKDFKEIYEAMSGMGFYITIYTNGTLITPDIAKWLGKSPPQNMELTLYGASAETYGKVTGNANAFNRAVDGLDLLMNAGINIQLRTTVIRDNACDYEKLMELADKRHLFLKFGYYISRRREEANAGLDEIRLSPYEISQYELRSGQDYTKRIKNLIPPEEIHKTGKDICKDTTLKDFPFKCQAGKTEFWITWDGRMSACPMMEDFVLNPVIQGFYNAWKELQNICKATPSCTECKDCSLRTYCWTCPARLKMETGSYDKSAGYFCEWAEYRKRNFKM